MFDVNSYKLSDLIERNEKDIDKEYFDKDFISDILDNFVDIKIESDFDIKLLYEIEISYRDLEMSNLYENKIQKISNIINYEKYKNLLTQIMNSVNSHNHITICNFIKNLNTIIKSDNINNLRLNTFIPFGDFIKFIENNYNDRIYFKSFYDLLIKTSSFIYNNYENLKMEYVICVVNMFKQVSDIIRLSLLFCSNFVDMLNSDSEENIYELDELLEISQEEYEYDFSLEATGVRTDSLPGKKKGFNPFKLLFELPKKVNKVMKRFKVFRNKAKNHFFYKKYIGRIDGLFEKYGEEAKITENKMKGDPVDILKNEAKEYITNVSNIFNNLSTELLDLAKRMSTTNNPRESLTLVKKYAGVYASEIKKPKDIKGVMEKSTMFKIAKVLLEGNKIYGYTTDSIAENNKLPPANHTIVSLFIEDPHEKPSEQSVTDIFKSADSFKLIAKNEKEPIITVAEICNDLISKGISKNDVKKLKNFKVTSRKNFELSKGEILNDETVKKPKKEIVIMRKQNSNIWNGIFNSIKRIVKMKGYVSELTDSYFTLMLRIDNLCKECVVSMLEIERMKKDERYKTGFKGTSLKKHKNYKQSEDDTKTKGEKEYAKMNENSEDTDSQKVQLQNRMNAIKAAMRPKL